MKFKENVAKVLAIAGSDSSGGAGIQADIKTVAAHKAFAMTAITAITAQNTKEITDIFPVSPDSVRKQIHAVFQDIRPDSIKIGMLGSKELVATIGKSLADLEADNIVVDPVMVATSGGSLVPDTIVESLIEELFPIARIITPNIPEAEVLSGMKISNREDMEKAAKKISLNFNGAILLKGGHIVEEIEQASDLLYVNHRSIWLDGPRILNPNTHGTGCTLSSAIAANLALGYDLITSVKNSKEYVSTCLLRNLNLGRGSGPLDHINLVEKSQV